MESIFLVIYEYIKEENELKLIKQSYNNQQIIKLRSEDYKNKRKQQNLEKNQKFKKSLETDAEKKAKRKQQNLEKNQKFKKSLETDSEKNAKRLAKQKDIDDRAKLDPEKKAQKLDTQKKYDDQATLNPKKKAQKLATQKKYDDQVKLNLEKKALKLATQKKHDDQVKLNPEKKAQKLATKKKYDDTKNAKESLQFHATRNAIQKSIGLTTLCHICNKLKCPDGVKTYESLDLVPLDLKVLMSDTDQCPAVCYYCKHLLRKGKIPETNELQNILEENRFMNNTKLQIIVDKTMENFNDQVFKFGEIRVNRLRKQTFTTKFDYVMSQLNEVDSINIKALTKKFTIRKKLEYSLGYLSCRSLLGLLIKINKDKILKDGRISEEGAIILTKYYFDQLLEQEKELILEHNRHFDKKMSFAKINNLAMLSEEFEDYIAICQSMVNTVYEKTNEDLMTMDEGLFKLKNGSKLINHLLKIVIPFQRLIHLPRGYSYKIKGKILIISLRFRVIY